MAVDIIVGDIMVVAAAGVALPRSIRVLLPANRASVGWAAYLEKQTQATKRKEAEMSKFIKIAGAALLIVAASAVPALARVVPPVPEIDPSLAPSAIALLSGGLLILRSRSKRK